jgi:hypothetical protein
MALSQVIQVGSTTLTDALIRIDRIIISRKGFDGEHLVEAVAAIYKSEESEPIDLRGYYFNLDMEGENPVKQAYLYLKTLPEFSDATDC